MLTSPKIINLLKESLNLEARDIASLISSSAMKISRLEKGEAAKLSLENFHHICAYLGVNLESFFMAALINFKNKAKGGLVEVRLNQHQAALIGTIQDFPEPMRDAFFSFMGHVQPKSIPEVKKVFDAPDDLKVD